MLSKFLIAAVFVASAAMLGSRGHAAPIQAYFNDFDGGEAFGGGVGGGLSGITTTAPVQSFPAPFSGNMLHNTTGNIFGIYGPDLTPITPTTLTLTGLPAHTNIDINFLLGVIDSWDGSGPANGGPDTMVIRVDGVVRFSGVIGNYNIGISDYVPPGGVLLSSGSDLGFNSIWVDRALNMGLDPVFSSIPHSASTLTIEWLTCCQGFSDGGTGWQGGTDESWGLDNVRVVLNTQEVPEPGTLVMLLCALIGLSAAMKMGCASGPIGKLIDA